jgi:hypothetical protein
VISRKLPAAIPRDLGISLGATSYYPFDQVRGHRRNLHGADYALCEYPIRVFIVPKMGSKAAKLNILPSAVSGVADALFSKVQQRVLAVLFGNHSRSFYANELIALAGSGSGAVQRELMQLSAAGLVTVTRIGNQKHYQADPSAPSHGGEA